MTRTTAIGPTPSTAPVGTTTGSRLDWALYAIGVVCLLWLDVSGAQLYPAEIVLGLLAVEQQEHRERPPVPPFLVVTLVIWALGTLASDLIADSELRDSARGFLRVVFLLTDLVGFWLIVRGRPQVAYRLWVAIAVGWGVGYLFWPSVYAATEPWKFGIAVPVTLAGALLLTRADRAGPLAPLGFVALAALNFALGFRSMAAVCGAVTVVLLLRVRRGRTLTLPQALPRLLLGAVLVVLATGAITTAYDQVALTGALGPNAQQKVQIQSAGDFGSLVTGRPGALPGLTTIALHPFFGLGSYSEPSATATHEIAELYHEWGYGSVASDIERGEAGFHSGLIGAWAENGIAALPFWIAVIAVLGGGLLAVVARRTRYASLVAFLCALGLWDVIFSPFGGDRRLWLAATLVLVLVCREPAPVRETDPAREPLPARDAP